MLALFSCVEVPRSRPGNHTDVNRPRASYFSSVTPPFWSTDRVGRPHAGATAVVVTQPSWFVTVFPVTGPPAEGVCVYAWVVFAPRTSHDSTTRPYRSC